MVEFNRNESQTIGTTASVVSKETGNNNTYRSSILLINTSTGGQQITLAIDGEAAAGAGIVLYPGGHWDDNEGDYYIPTQKVITAISSAAGGKLAIQERVISK